MLLFILILAASNIGVHSLRCIATTNQLCSGSYNQICCRDPYESPPILPCEAIYLPQKTMPVSIPVAVMPETTMCLQRTNMPMMPFINELPNCPDLKTTNQPCSGSYNQIICCKDPYESPPILPCERIYLSQKAMPVAVVPEPTVCLQQTTMPVMPFITELPNCPDICFNEILMSPLGCLDPILTIYGTKNVCPLPELPVSPLLSPVSSLASSFSKLLPPVCDCECYTRPIPPPFI